MGYLQKFGFLKNCRNFYLLDFCPYSDDERTMATNSGFKSRGNTIACTSRQLDISSRGVLLWTQRAIGQFKERKKSEKKMCNYAPIKKKKKEC